MLNNLLIFDCDGVLVDSELISLGLLIDHCNDYGLLLDMKQACDCFLGKPVATAGAEASRIHNVSVPGVDLGTFQEKVLNRFEKELKPVTRVIDALQQLERTKCVASSSNLERIKASMKLTGLSDFFSENIFSTDMVARGKPHPDVFLHACYQMDFRPENAIVIEDSPAGLQAAHAANIKTIAFTGASHAEDADLKRKLEMHSPTILIEDMSELPKAILALEGT